MHPAPDFPVYAPVDMPGPRWVSMYHGSAGNPLWAISITHGEADPESADPSLTVTSAPRRRWQETMAGHGLDGSDEFAWSLPAIQAVELVRARLRGRDLKRRRNELRELAVDQQGGRYREWPTVAWTIDGQSLTAHVFQVDDAWGAFTAALPDIYVAADGVGVEPAGLEFAITDGREYGVDFSSALSFPADLHESRRLAGLRP